MASDYLNRASVNILPLSVQQSLPDAFNEWNVTGELIDHRQAIENCKLCDKEGLRYHFGISNLLTGGHLWVGSQCIKRFEIAMYEEGRLLTGREVGPALNRLLKKFRIDACMKALRALATKEQRENLQGAVRYFDQHGNLSPKLANIVLWRLSANGIDHDPRWFKVALRRSYHQNDLRALPTAQVHRMWPALTSGQRALAVRLGHVPPPPKLP